MHTITTDTNNYGIIPANFRFNIADGYSVFAGRNNAGKSTLLQLIFKTFVNTASFGLKGVAFITTDRYFVRPNTMSNESLTTYNRNLLDHCVKAPRISDNPGTISTKDLYSILLQDTNLKKQNQKIDEYLFRLGFGEFVIGGGGTGQQVHIETMPVHQNGAGLRCLLPILAALTSPNIKLVIVDEPELSLEARAQKTLKKILLESSADKLIVVATQSHLFLNNEKIDQNAVVSKEADEFLVTSIDSPDKMLDTTYNLLGNSLEDLFFPGNYLIVEGASDQIIVDRVLNLMGVSSTKVKVISARGQDNVLNSYNAIRNMIVTSFVTSPYKNKVVVLLDKPKPNYEGSAEDIKKTIRERCFVLDGYSIEESIPESLYKRLDKDRDSVLKEIEELKNKSSLGVTGATEKMFILKKKISNELASILKIEDIDSLLGIKDAVNLAIKNANSDI